MNAAEAGTPQTSVDVQLSRLWRLSSFELALKRRTEATTGTSVGHFQGVISIMTAVIHGAVGKLQKTAPKSRATGNQTTEKIIKAHHCLLHEIMK